MGTASWILLGNKRSLDLSFGSTAHGAGRIMSRSAAKRSHTADEVKRSLESKGIYIKALTKEGIVEETPNAYKDVDAVVDVSHSLGYSYKSSKINTDRRDKGLMSEDPDINIIKARKMKEMRELAAAMEKARMKKQNQNNRSKTSEIISRYLYDRGQEVLNLAESQFPLQTKAIINRIVELISTGEINQRISGGELLALFRAVGINVRVTTSIKIKITASWFHSQIN